MTMRFSAILLFQSLVHNLFFKSFPFYRLKHFFFGLSELGLGGFAKFNPMSKQNFLLQNSLGIFFRFLGIHSKVLDLTFLGVWESADNLSPDPSYLRPCFKKNRVKKLSQKSRFRLRTRFSIKNRMPVSVSVNRSLNTHSSSFSLLMSYIMIECFSRHVFLNYAECRERPRWGAGDPLFPD